MLPFGDHKRPVITVDSDSYKTVDLNTTVEIPLYDHVGAFGVTRKHHIHEGIDLYGNPGDAVYAMRPGIVIAEFAFTGPAVGMPWWNDTRAIAVQDDLGTWVYGEIDTGGFTHIGQEISHGQYLGQLIPVLKVDKGRPMTMLHLERWRHGITPTTILWSLNTPQPEFLSNPTPHLFD